MDAWQRSFFGLACYLAVQHDGKEAWQLGNGKRCKCNALCLSALRCDAPCLSTLKRAVLCRYDWFGNHNTPWETDLNSVNSTIDWNKINVLTATPNLFDNRDASQTGGGFGLLPWYLRSALAAQQPPPPPSAAPSPGDATQATG
jgi:hypothetical protein